MENKPVREKRRTILVVDDDIKIRKLVAQIVSMGNRYNVLMATSGSLGLQQSREFDGEISLLLTGFQMPGMSGVDLAVAMTKDRPDLKVLLMSGFPDGMLVLNEGWHFLAKPFVASQLQALIVGLVYPETASKFATPPSSTGEGS
jgi:DNA-binding NtrC family response regulator